MCLYCCLAGEIASLKATIVNTGNVRLRNLTIDWSWSIESGAAVCTLQQTLGQDQSALWVAGMDVPVGQQVVCLTSYTTSDNSVADGMPHIHLGVWVKSTVGQHGSQLDMEANTTVTVFADPSSAASMRATFDKATCTVPESAGACVRGLLSLAATC